MKAGKAVQADPVEGGGSQSIQQLEGKMSGTPSPINVSTKLQKIAKLASDAPELTFTTLAHHIDVDFLREAYRRTRKDGAAGMDYQTAEQYAADLEGNLARLHDRFKSGQYRAPAVRRVYIPKSDGRTTRPIGIPTFEDKVLQRAVVMVLEAIYEQNFLDCSYGFRPKRSAHQALEALWTATMRKGGGWVLEMDIESFFDTVDHSHLRNMLDQRVRDGVIRRVIGKWLNAGVFEEGAIRRTQAGTPQGGVISPLLANIYLHHVLDVWFTQVVCPRLRGLATLVRYADDAVIVFDNESDAQRVMEVLPKRFGKYGLRLHPDKTRLIDFRWLSDDDNSRRGDGRSFTMLGFTHHWGLSRKGNPVVKRRTSAKSLNRALRNVGEWCRTHRHWDLTDQHTALVRKVRGHYAYFGVTGNSRALSNFVQQVERRWRYWLHRRSNSGKMTWERFARLLRRLPLPTPKIMHSIYRPAAKG
jgi:group II intron reverse transcriptase/maturase